MVIQELQHMPMLLLLMTKFTLLAIGQMMKGVVSNFGGDNPTTNHPKGSWYIFTETKYLGIKINEKLGWIEIDNTDRYHPVIKSFAIQK